MDERIKKLAHNLIHYSCEVKPKERVMIHVFGSSAYPLARQLVKETYAAGGFPYVQLEDYSLSLIHIFLPPFLPFSCRLRLLSMSGLTA